MTTSSPAAAPRRPVQNVSMVVGAIFLLLGVLGFIPGVTTNYDTLQFAGHESEALLLGLFQVSILHNILHLLFGVAGFVLARTPGLAVGYLMGGGTIYALLWLYGILIDRGSAANFVPLNTADNWLHLGLAILMVLLGTLVPGSHVDAPKQD